MNIFKNFSLMKLKSNVKAVRPTALGWVIIIGFISLITMTEAAKSSINLPMIPDDSVWKLLVERGGFFIAAALMGIGLGILLQEARSEYLHLKMLKILDKILNGFFRGFCVFFLISLAMKCSLTEFKQSACFNGDQADKWLCEGTLMLIVNGIIWLFVLSLIAYVTSRPRFVAALYRCMFKPSPSQTNTQSQNLVLEAIPLNSASGKGEGQ
jgi:hypothetical protein